MKHSNRIENEMLIKKGIEQMSPKNMYRLIHGLPKSKKAFGHETESFEKDYLSRLFPSSDEYFGND
jgi:hypothetical protein